MNQLYSTAELASMTAEEVNAAKANGFVKPTVVPERNTSGRHVESVEANLSHADPYAVTSWGTLEYDFRVPSGQLCRMTKLLPEELMANGILNKITRLPGYAQELADKAAGTPPKKTDDIDESDMQSVLEVLEILLPMVVVRPTVVASNTPKAEVPAGAVLVKQIDLGDRIAIMERAMGGVTKLDNFRQEP